MTPETLVKSHFAFETKSDPYILFDSDFAFHFAPAVNSVPNPVKIADMARIISPFYPIWHKNINKIENSLETLKFINI